eukprot:3939617-Amphidinium_carterae.1
MKRTLPGNGNNPEGSKAAPRKDCYITTWLPVFSLASYLWSQGRKTLVFGAIEMEAMLDGTYNAFFSHYICHATLASCMGSIQATGRVILKLIDDVRADRLQRIIEVIRWFQ